MYEEHILANGEDMTHIPQNVSDQGFTVCTKDMKFLLEKIDYLISLTIRQSFFFQNNPKNLEPSDKMDLDHWDCLGRVKLVAKFLRTDLVTRSHSRERKTLSYSPINTVISHHTYWYFIQENVT